MKPELKEIELPDRPFAIPDKNRRPISVYFDYEELKMLDKLKKKLEKDTKGIPVSISRIMRLAFRKMAKENGV